MTSSYLLLNIMLMVTCRKWMERREINDWETDQQCKNQKEFQKQCNMGATGEEITNQTDFKGRFKRIWCWIGWKGQTNRKIEHNCKGLGWGNWKIQARKYRCKRQVAGLHFRECEFSTEATEKEREWLSFKQVVYRLLTLTW